MTDAQRENLRALLLAAQAKARVFHTWDDRGDLPVLGIAPRLAADLDSALRELEEGADG